MKVYKFTINVSPLHDSNTYESVNKEFESLLGDVNKYVGYTNTDDSKMVMYFYSDCDKTMMSLYDILFDYKLFIDVKEITDDVKSDWTQFDGIDDITNNNYNLLSNFIVSEYNNDFILDYIIKNGESRFKSEILEKFIPQDLR